MIDEKLKKFKLNCKKQIDKLRNDKNKIYQNAVIDLKRDSMNFINGNKMSNEYKQNLINNNFKQFYKNKNKNNSTYLLNSNNSNQSDS